MRASKFSCNNIGELNILNRIYKIQISPKKVYSNVSKNKRSKVILLEKTSPNHYPVYVKFVKKINAPIFENTCYLQSIHIIKEKVGQMSPSGQGLKPITQCKFFLQHFNLANIFLLLLL